MTWLFDMHVRSFPIAVRLGAIAQQGIEDVTPRLMSVSDDGLVMLVC